MLSIFGRSSGHFCDHVSRRDVLRIGALGLGGLTLADLHQGDAWAGATSKCRSIINVILSGGLSHIDSFDMKPDAPVEIRGDFKPIQTSVPGIQICEHLPRLARSIDKLAIVRSMHGFFNEHTDSQADSGWVTRANRPGLGAVVSKVLGPADRCPVSSVSLGTKHMYNGPLTSPGFLGQTYKDYEPFGPGSPFGGKDAKKAGSEGGENDGALLGNLKLKLDAGRFESRKELLGAFDTVRAEVDRTGAYAVADTFTKKALDLVLSGAMADALDLQKVSAKTRQAYGITGEHDEKQVFILACRLIEAGVRVVSLQFSGWDTHYDNFGELKRKLPQLDLGLSGLLSDLKDRGLLEDTMVLVSTEFGRTPRIQEEGKGRGPGRSHWPAAGTFLLAGGGVRMGQVIGSTNRLGERPEDRPVHLQQLFATVYHQLGIDVNAVQLTDATGRPHYILDHREIVQELV